MSHVTYVKYSKYPGLILSVDNNPVEMEMPFPINSMEGWHLYALLKSARRMHFLVEQCLPLLKAASLLEPNDNVEALEKLLKGIPQEAVQSQAQFYTQRTYQQSLLHDPKQVRQRPGKSLFL